MDWHIKHETESKLLEAGKEEGHDINEFIVKTYEEYSDEEIEVISVSRKKEEKEE